MPKTLCYGHFLCLFASSRLIALCFPNCKPLWIKASAKWLNVVNVNVIRGPKFAKKISPTPVHHHHQPEPLRQGRMDPCFHVLYTKFWPYHLNVAAEIETHQTRQRFSIFYCPILVSLCELYPPCAVLIWQERHSVCSSAVEAHLLQGSTCCVFRDGILHTLVVTSGNLSYICLSIISNLSSHSPLISDINKAFSSTQLPLTGYFLFFWLFSVNPIDGCE